MLDNIITIYQEMTGKIVPAALQPQYIAWGRRALRELENKLGWQFDRKDYLNVLGVSPKGCDCDVKISALKAAPMQRGQYRVFNYDPKQPIVMTDPFTKVYGVYICKIEPEGRYMMSDNDDVVVLKQVDNYTPRYFNRSFGKYLQACEEMSVCHSQCEHGCNKCSAILVDADWIKTKNAPDDLLFLMCDYIDWMAAGGLQNRGLKSESVDGHSVSYRDDLRAIEPYGNNDALATIQQYAGPYGMADRKLIW